MTARTEVEIRGVRPLGLPEKHGGAWWQLVQYLLVDGRGVELDRGPYATRSDCALHAADPGSNLTPRYAVFKGETFIGTRRERMPV